MVALAYPETGGPAFGQARSEVHPRRPGRRVPGALKVPLKHIYLAFGRALARRAGHAPCIWGWVPFRARGETWFEWRA